MLLHLLLMLLFGVLVVIAAVTAIAMAALIAWNLTDEDGAPLSLDTPAAKLESLNRLPTEVFSQIVAAVQGVAKGAKDKNGGASERKFPR